MSKKTKILAAGDIHGDKNLVKRLAARAKKENVDLVILAGDITFAETSTKDLIGPFVKEKKPVLILHGNHEHISTTDFLAELYSGTTNLHGYSFRKGDIGIFGAGGTPGVNISEKEIYNALKQGHTKLKDSKKKVMVTHMHAEDTQSEFSGWKGSKAIRKAIETFKPDLFIHSHIHEGEGLEEKIGKTKIINVGRRGRIFEI